MSYKESQQSPASYVDDIKVKISEKYKPPRKINLALSYSQRLSLNKQIQDSIPTYAFDLERSTLEHLKELKNSRKNLADQRKERLEKARDKLKEKDLKDEKDEEDESKTVEETSKATPSSSSQSYLCYPTSASMLLPTVNTYSNILTPIPLNVTHQSGYSATEKRPFNISDFEDDTSSPFDNVALKSINDMEELAKVLKSEGGYKPPENAYTLSNQASASVYSNYTPIQSNVMGYSGQYNSNHYNSYIPNTLSYVAPTPVPSTYSHMNGYYYPSPDVVNQSYGGMSYDYNKIPDVSTSQSMKNCKSVPDIIKSLEEELKNTSFDTDENVVCRSVPTPSRPKNIDVVYSKPKVKEPFKDPLAELSKIQQELCRSISSMGFPLDRVVRVRRIIGDDQKKIVDHLLAMSELLDLGFAETDVSTALLQFDNDRDKALDKLVS